VTLKAREYLIAVLTLQRDFYSAQHCLQFEEGLPSYSRFVEAVISSMKKKFQDSETAFL
jgi:hypothetical protein